MVLGIGGALLLWSRGHRKRKVGLIILPSWGWWLSVFIRVRTGEKSSSDSVGWCARGRARGPPRTLQHWLQHWFSCFSPVLALLLWSRGHRKEKEHVVFRPCWTLRLSVFIHTIITTDRKNFGGWVGGDPKITPPDKSLRVGFRSAVATPNGLTTRPVRESPTEISSSG